MKHITMDEFKATVLSHFPAAKFPHAIVRLTILPNGTVIAALSSPGTPASEDPSYFWEVSACDFTPHLSGSGMTLPAALTSLRENLADVTATIQALEADLGGAGC